MSSPAHPIGHNRLAQMAPIFADCCGFTNAKKYNAHGNQALNITMLSNLSVSVQMKLKASRHLNIKSISRYQHITDENIEKKYEAMNPFLLKNSISDGNIKDS